MGKYFESVRDQLKANPSLSVVILEGFFARLGFGVITFALPFYALALGMSFTEIGILAALRLVAAILFKPFMGWAADRFGKKTIYVLSISGRALVGVMLVFATQPWMLFAIRFFHGITTAARDPAAAILIAEHGNKDKMATAYAWYGTAREVGASVGFLVAGFLLTFTNDNYSLAFAFAVITSIIALFVVLIFVKEHRVSDTVETKQKTELEKEKQKTPWMEFALFGLMAALTGSMVTNLFPVIATEIGQISKAQTSVIVTLSTLVIVFAGPWFGWLSDHVSRTLVLSLRAIANALSSVLYMFAPNLAGISAARVFDDAGKAAFRPAWGSLMAEISGSRDKRNRGKTIAYMDTAQSVGEALGPVIAGLLWDQAGIVWLFAVRLGLSIATEVYAVFVLKQHKH